MKSVKYFAGKFGVSIRRIRLLCEQRRVIGAVKDEHDTWLIPENAIFVAGKRKGPPSKIVFQVV